jgi:hypothetical protein
MSGAVGGAVSLSAGLPGAAFPAGAVAVPPAAGGPFGLPPQAAKTNTIAKNNNKNRFIRLAPPNGPAYAGPQCRTGGMPVRQIRRLTRQSRQ